MASPSSAAKPRVFLIGNADKPDAVRAFKMLVDFLDHRGMLVGSDLDGRPEEVNKARPDFVIALGGDGTILYAGQAMQHRQVPIIGVNMGKLGYLADFDATEIQDSLDELTSNPGLLSCRMMLDVRIEFSSGQNFEGIALNDCVIRVGDPFRTINLDIRIDHHPLCRLVGDGVVLATPTGSTAHNMSCGGPIVAPGVGAIIVTPKSPHSFTHRPVLVSSDSEVCVSVAAAAHGGYGTAAVLDGQSVHRLPPDTRVFVTRSKESFQLVRNPKRTPWETLITKLKWGQDVT